MLVCPGHMSLQPDGSEVSPSMPFQENWVILPMGWLDFYLCLLLPCYCPAPSLAGKGRKQDSRPCLTPAASSIYTHPPQTWSRRLGSKDDREQAGALWTSQLQQHGVGR